MPRVVTFEKARKAAFRGEVETATGAFQNLRARGEYRAVAALANIAAFRGEIDECLNLVADLIENGPVDDLRAGLADAVRLLAWIGHQRRIWDDVIQICTRGLHNFRAKSGEPWSGDNIALVPDPPIYDRALAERNPRILENFIAYARRHGEAPHELIGIFGVPQPPTSPEEQRRRYEYAVDNMYTLCPYLRGKPEEAARHRYFLAKGFGQPEEAVQAFFGHPQPIGHFLFRDALYVVRVFACRGELDRGWGLVRDYLPHWYPETDWTRIAPIELLVEPELAPMMTAERCEAVLRCPRSGETAQEREARTVRKRNRNRAKRLPPVPVLQIISFNRVEAPIREPVTKFGGQPVWIDRPQWPVGRALGRPMYFVCQIELRPEIFGGESGRMAYLFVDEGDEEHNTAFWDAQSGDNAVIIQPGGTVEVPTLDTAIGPTLWDGIDSWEWLPELQPGEDPPVPLTRCNPEISKSEYERWSEHMGRDKIGGTPFFCGDHIEYPDDSGGWRLLLQLNDGTLDINCCMGVGYAFISQDGKRGGYFCQRG